MPTEQKLTEPGHGPVPASEPATPSPKGSQRRWRGQLGGDSLRGRYLYLALGFALLLPRF